MAKNNLTAIRTTDKDALSNTWELNFELLKDYLLKNNGDYSKLITNRKQLYGWVGRQRKKYHAKQLNGKQVEYLESLNFVWDIKENNWRNYYNELKQFRLDNPGKWPKYNKKNKRTLENNLNVFCQSIRSKYRSNNLSDYWLTKFNEIDFDWESDYNWFEKATKIEKIIKTHCPDSLNKWLSNTDYSWIWTQWHKYLQEGHGGLAPDKCKLLETLNLSEYFKPWVVACNEVELWIKEHGKNPTNKTNSKFNKWISNQKTSFANGTLLADRIEKLYFIDFNKIGTRKDTDKKRWMEQFNVYEKFIKENRRDPSHVHEKKLYAWAQTQRAVMAKNVKRRNELESWKIDALNGVNFKWSRKEKNEGNWDNNFNKLKAFLTHNEPSKLSTVNDETKPIYIWFMNQKSAYKYCRLAQQRILKLKKIGIDLDQKEFINALSNNTLFNSQQTDGEH